MSTRCQPSNILERSVDRMCGVPYQCASPSEVLQWEMYWSIVVDRMWRVSRRKVANVWNMRLMVAGVRPAMSSRVMECNCAYSVKARLPVP